MQAAVHGVVDERFAGVRDELASRLAADDELGASIAVVADGARVVDIWGGWADAARTRPWAADTVTTVWSCSKTVTNLAALLLVDRGELDPSAPVCRYWPEFGVNGKADIQVRDVLGHTSGLSGWDAPVSPTDLYDRDEAVQRLARQRPWWTPRSAPGYHLITQGHLVGEIVRRVTGTPIEAFVEAELAGPLDAQFTFGAPENIRSRIAEIIAPPPVPVDLASLDPTSVAVRSLTGPALDATVTGTPGWRDAVLPAANGHANARALATIQAVVSHEGTVFGRRLLSPSTVARIFEVQADGVDLVAGEHRRLGIGFGLPTPLTAPLMPRHGRICFWAGWGGSMVVNDLDRRMTVAYVMNRMQPGLIGSRNAAGYLAAVYRTVGVELDGYDSTPAADGESTPCLGRGRAGG